MKYRLVTLLSAGHLVTDINQGALPALLPFLIMEYGLSFTAAAGIVFAANISSTVVQPLFGHYADRFSRPWIIPLGFFTAGLGMALIGFTSNYTWMILAAMLSGIGIAAFHPEGARRVNFAAGNQKATAMSFFGVGGFLGFAIGPLFITAAVLSWGLQGTLVLLVPVSIMVIVYLFQLPQLSALETSTKVLSKGASKERDDWGSFGRLTLIVVIRSILFYGLITFVPLYWIHVLHQSETAGGTALTVLSVSGVIGNLLGGRLADRLGHSKVLLVGVALLIPILPMLIWISDPMIAMLLLIPIGLSLSATYSPAVILGQKYLPNRIGLSSGVTLGVAVAIGGVAVPVLGKIADHHGVWMALVSIMFLPILSSGLILTLMRSKAQLALEG